MERAELIVQATTLYPVLEQIIYPNLPLAVYREIAAHLRQISGIETALIPQQCQQFDYWQSQIECLQIVYSINFNVRNRLWVEKVLNYYAQIYGSYERKPVEI